MGAVGNRRIVVESPVGGLSRRQLPFSGVLAQAVAAVAPAGVMSIVPTLVLNISGANLLLTFALALLVCLLVALTVTPMAQRMAGVSGLYGYVARGLGPQPALFAGWSALFGYALIGMAGLFAVGSYLAQAASKLGVPTIWTSVVTVLVIVSASVAMTTAMVRGVKVSAWLVLGVECLAILILLGLMLWYLIAVGVPHGQTPAGRNDAGGIAVGVVLGVGAFVGFESSTTLGGEARKPLQAIPRALMWTMLIGGLPYLLAVSFQQYVLRPQQPPGSSTPLVALLNAHDSTAIAVVIDLCIASSFFACAVASLSAFVRVMFCMGREGILPRTVGRTHPRFRTPAVAVLLTMPVITVVPVFVAIAKVPAADALTALILLSAFGYLGSYLLAAASMPIFLRRIGEERAANRWLSLASVIVLGLVMIGAIVLWAVRAPSLPIIYLTVLAAAAGHLWLIRRRWPNRLAGMGVYDETLADDIFDPTDAWVITPRS